MYLPLELERLVAVACTCGGGRWRWSVPHKINRRVTQEYGMVVVVGGVTLTEKGGRGHAREGKKGRAALPNIPFISKLDTNLLIGLFTVAHNHPI